MSKNDISSMITGNHPAGSFISSLLITIIAILILLLVGEYLWNNVLVKVTTFIKPVSSVWQILGIMLLIKLLFC